MENSNQIQDIYYNPWADLDFDQNNQLSVPDTLPNEESLPTEEEALQLAITTKKNKKKRKDLYDNSIGRKLLQIRELLQHRVNDLKLDKILWILSDIRFLLYPCLSKSFKDLDKKFMRLYYAKEKNSYNKLVKQVIRKIDSYYK
jgi:hypothetical protein